MSDTYEGKRAQPGPYVEAWVKRPVKPSAPITIPEPGAFYRERPIAPPAPTKLYRDGTIRQRIAAALYSNPRATTAAVIRCVPGATRSNICRVRQRMKLPPTRRHDKREVRESIDAILRMDPDGILTSAQVAMYAGASPSYVSTIRGKLVGRRYARSVV
jgi:hypothetical protein